MVRANQSYCGFLLSVWLLSNKGAHAFVVSLPKIYPKTTTATTFFARGRKNPNYFEGRSTPTNSTTSLFSTIEETKGTVETTFIKTCGVNDSSGVSLQNPSLEFARFLVLVASAVYGTNFSVVKVLDERVPLAVSAALRFSLAAFIVGGIVLATEDTANDIDAQKRTEAAFGGMEIGGWYCAGYLCQAIGLQTADASKSAFFNALAVIFVPLLDSLFRQRKMELGSIVSVILAMLGVGLLQLGPSIVSGTPLTITSGDLFCLGQALLFGIGYWRLEDVSTQYPSEAGRVTVGQLGGVALGSIAFCAAGGLPDVSALQGWLSDEMVVGALLWTALVSTALALYLETVALKAISASELTILMTSVSLFGSAFAYLTIGETMTPISMLGGLLILGGCLTTATAGKNHREEDEEGLRNQLIMEEDWHR